jgi:hypothetical protein
MARLFFMVGWLGLWVFRRGVGLDEVAVGFICRICLTCGSGQLSVAKLRV